MIRRFSLFDIKSKYDEESLELATEYLERVRQWILWQRPDREKLLDSYFSERWEWFLVLAASVEGALYAHDVEAYAKEVDGLFPELVRIALS